MTEGNIITTAVLKGKWEDTLTFFNELVDDGHKLRPIQFLIRHIIDKGYDARFYPGTSLFNLLISMPLDNKINYDKTLRVSIDQIYHTVSFKYRDTTGLDKTNSYSLSKAFHWSETCHLTEINDTFEYFLTQIDDWTSKR